MKEQRHNNERLIYQSMKKKLLCFINSILSIVNVSAQSNEPWQGKKAAVVITYDDAINEHFDNAIPVLGFTWIESNILYYRFSRLLCNHG